MAADLRGPRADVLRERIRGLRRDDALGGLAQPVDERDVVVRADAAAAAVSAQVNAVFKGGNAGIAEPLGRFDGHGLNLPPVGVQSHRHPLGDLRERLGA